MNLCYQLILSILLYPCILHPSIRSATIRLSTLLSQLSSQQQKIVKTTEYTLDEQVLRQHNEQVPRVIRRHLFEHRHLVDEQTSLKIKFIILSSNTEQLFDMLQEVLYKQQFPPSTINYTQHSVTILFTLVAQQNPLKNYI